MATQNNTVHQEISILELLRGAKDLWRFLFTKWRIILLFGFLGGAIGLAIAFVVKPKYTATLSFALVEKSSGGGGLADLASSFGFSGLMSGSQNAFSGDNLLEILKSRHTIENTLLTAVDFNGKKQTLADSYIDINNFRNDWVDDKKHPEMASLSFPIGQARKSFSRAQDSVLYKFSSEFVEKGKLLVNRKDKKLSFVSIDFTSVNEIFSKIFVETLIDKTYEFYKETKTSQSRANISMMQAKADSIRRLYEMSLERGAGYSPVNINSAMQSAAVPRLKQENNAQLYAAVYAEVLKNLESLKLDLARETPIVQVIDNPILPLKRDKIGKLFALFSGFFVGAFISVMCIILAKNINKLLDRV